MKDEVETVSWVISFWRENIKFSPICLTSLLTFVELPRLCHVCHVCSSFLIHDDKQLAK